MRHLFISTFILLLVSAVLPVTVQAGGQRIELLRPGTINGVELEAGQYKLVLNGQDVAEFYRGRKLVVKANFKRLPLGNATPGSISQNADGTLSEVRLQRERVVFVTSQASAQSGR